MENCHGEFITTELNAKTCMDSVLSKKENPSKVHDISDTQSKSGTELRSEGMSNIPAQATNISQVPDGGLSGSELAGVNPECPNAANQILFAVLKWKKKTEDAKVRWRCKEACNFCSDFKHSIESKYSKKDAVTFLRASLQGKLLTLIEGIGSDYDAAWEYLDSI